MARSPGARVYVIAEAGVNHNGDPELALELVDAAAEAGADAVKFQTFTAEELVTADAPKARYQTTTTDASQSQFDMIKGLELSKDAHRALLRRSIERGLEFLSTPFDRASLRFLVDDLGLGTVKIGSGEITNGPLLLEAARSARRIILSTGMSTLDEMEDALAVLAFGLSGARTTPSRSAFAKAYASRRGREALQSAVVILHCTSEYPAPFADVNLRAMATMRDAFGLPVGLSDHSAGIAIPVAAVALDAVVVEKHLTLDREAVGPDHASSLEPGEFANMVAGIRAVEQALGDGVKAARPSEIANIEVCRRSLVTLAAVGAGEPFTVENLGAKRPGGGVSPMELWNWLERRAPRDFQEDEIIQLIPKKTTNE